jgi:hypothetical protein
VRWRDNLPDLARQTFRLAGGNSHLYRKHIDRGTVPPQSRRRYALITQELAQLTTRFAQNQPLTVAGSMVKLPVRCAMSEDTGGPLPHDVGRLARRLFALGLSVIPVPRPQPGVPPGHPGDGKVPAIAWSAYQKRRPTAREIDAWFGAAPMNLAVITDQLSGAVVVDADEPEALRWLVRRLPWTPWQTQTARGFHLWYRHPGVRVPNRARVETGVGKLKIDVRGDGGYVIAWLSPCVRGGISAGGRLERTAGPSPGVLAWMAGAPTTARPETKTTPHQPRGSRACPCIPGDHSQAKNRVWQ